MQLLFGFNQVTLNSIFPKSFILFYFAYFLSSFLFSFSASTFCLNTCTYLLCPSLGLLSFSALFGIYVFSLLLPSPHLQYGGGCSELGQLWRSGPVLHWQAEQTHCVGSTRQQARLFQPLLWLFPSCKNTALLLCSWLCLTSINSGLKVLCAPQRCFRGQCFDLVFNNFTVALKISTSTKL